MTLSEVAIIVQIVQGLGQVASSDAAKSVIDVVKDKVGDAGDDVHKVAEAIFSTVFHKDTEETKEDEE